ncbi:MAG: type II toxin-antitoxin system VapC family toxin [Cyclobacteriaceae bacterium]|nr:type II toxin-antitoxin system VapC family toxin [Cyclobacteriaceae bacterium]
MKKTGKRYLIDTNVIVDLFGNDEQIKVKLSTVKIIIPSVVVGELYFGAYASSKEKTRINEVSEFIGNYEVIYIDEDTARYYGQIKAQLKKSGTPILENDVWISALSMQHDLTLATGDLHFDKPKGIKVEYW